MSSKILALFTVGVLLGSAGADVVRLRPVADTGLFEFAPDNNLGGTDRLQIGFNGGGTRGRGLYRFDPIAGGIPRGSLIHSVSLRFHVSAAGGGATPVRHDLHRVRLEWEEGGQGSNQGLPANDGETTWCSRRHSEASWTVPGGNIGTDFAPAASADTVLGGVGEYVFESTPALVADVQSWVDETTANDGWVLISSDESTNGNTRRIGSRESGALAPVITIDYTPFAITEISEIGVGRYHLVWTGGTPPFEIDTSADGAVWESVASLSVNERNANVAGQFGTGLLRVRERAAPETTARYRVDWTATWSSATHPTSFPGGAHFSGPIGATHNGSVSFWQLGGTATNGIERMAESGSTSSLAAEVNVAIGAGTADLVLVGGSINSPGGTSFEFDVSQSHPLVTLVTMIAPSPDWFVGVHGLDLFEGGRWAESLTVALDPYDAGTDSGATYVSPNADNDEPISRLTGAPFLDGDKVRPIGTFTFTRLDN